MTNPLAGSDARLRAAAAQIASDIAKEHLRLIERHEAGTAIINLEVRRSLAAQAIDIATTIEALPLGAPSSETPTPETALAKENARAAQNYRDACRNLRGALLDSGRDVHGPTAEAIVGASLAAIHELKVRAARSPETPGEPPPPPITVGEVGRLRDDVFQMQFTARQVVALDILCALAWSALSDSPFSVERTPETRGEPPRITDSPERPTAYGVRRCRGHWHVVSWPTGEDIISNNGDNFATLDEALDAADNMNATLSASPFSGERTTARTAEQTTAGSREEREHADWLLREMAEGRMREVKRRAREGEALGNVVSFEGPVKAALSDGQLTFPIEAAAGQEVVAFIRSAVSGTPARSGSGEPCKHLHIIHAQMGSECRDCHTVMEWSNISEMYVARPSSSRAALPSRKNDDENEKA